MRAAMKRSVIRRKAAEPRATADGDPDPRDGGVQSVDRALLVIETLAEDDEGYPLSDLAVRTGLSTSTAHRLLATLERRRFVQFDRFEIEMACRRAEFRRRYDFRTPPQFRGAGHAISA
jgi:IclR family acetate operon transcriptional repressor